MVIRMRDTQAEISKDVRAIAGIEVVPVLLEVLCETTGMGFAVVARVTEGNWTACAVRDDIGFGLKAGDQIDVDTTFCREVRQDRTPIFMDRASTDPRYRAHQCPKLYGFESYVSVPIVLGNDYYFGNLCALDPKPLHVSDPQTLSLFTRFAAMIAARLDAQPGWSLSTRETEVVAEPPAQGRLGEMNLAILRQDLRRPLQGIAAGMAALEKRSWDPASAEVIARVNKHAARLKTLVDDLLDFARGRLAEGVSVHRRNVERLELLFADLAQEHLAAYPGRTLISHVTLSRAVYCDPDRIEQLTCYLLTNAAARGTAQGPVSLIVHAENADLVIEVWCDGEPIPKSQLRDLFAPGWSRAGVDGQDLGLGLHICALIVAAHGGKISATSSKSLGTQIVARIPLAAR